MVQLKLIADFIILKIKLLNKYIHSYIKTIILKKIKHNKKDEIIDIPESLNIDKTYIELLKQNALKKKIRQLNKI